MNRLFLILLFFAFTISSAEDGRNLDDVLDAVYRQIRSSDRVFSEEILADPSEIVSYQNARDLLHYSVSQSSDKRVQITYAIVSLNSIIEYFERYGNVEEDHPGYENYLKMKETRLYLAKAYQSLEAEASSEQKTNAE